MKCSNNLKQMGIALQMYTGDNNSTYPSLKWDPTGSVWYPYEMARFTAPNDSGLDVGWENLGLLYATKLLPSPAIFYCGSNPRDPRYCVDHEWTSAGATGAAVERCRVEPCDSGTINPDN